MYVSSISNNLSVSDSKKVKLFKNQNPSLKKTQLLLDSQRPLKKINRCMNIALISLLPVFFCQLQNQFNEITKEYIQYKPLVKDFETQERALNYSIERISEYLNADEPKEYSIHINNKKHRIISEVLGNDSTVLHFTPTEHLYNWATTSNFSYTSLHGHPVSPNGATSSFSFQDFRTFVHNENCSSTYVINKDGKYCRLEKTSDYKKLSEEEIENLEKDFEYHFHYSWDTKKTIYNSNGEVVFELVDYPGMHVFWDNVAKQYGMKYVTTFGTYGLYKDIYSNGYHEGFDTKEEFIRD